MKRCLHLKIYGRVQGVGFRFSAERKMNELGLAGWVRNCDDGGVETEVTGEEGAIERYLKWCQKGPMFAKVEKVEEEE